MKPQPIKRKIKRNWSEGFLDGLTCAVEVLATNGEQNGAEMLLVETGMRIKILMNSKINNPEMFEKLKANISEKYLR